MQCKQSNPAFFRSKWVNKLFRCCFFDSTFLVKMRTCGVSFFLLVQKKQTKQNAKQEKGQAVKNWSTEAPKRMSRRRRQKKMRVKCATPGQCCCRQNNLFSPLFRCHPFNQQQHTRTHTHYSPKKWLLDKHNDSLVSFIAYVFNFKHWKFHSHARVHTQVERLQVSPVNNSKPFYFLSFDTTSVLFWVIIRLLNVNSVVFQSLSFNLTGRKKVAVKNR